MAFSASGSGQNSWSGIPLNGDPYGGQGLTNAQAAIANAQTSVGGSFGLYQAQNGPSRQQIDQNAMGQAQGYAGMAANAGQQGILQAGQLAGPVQGYASQLGGMGAGIANQFGGNSAYANQALQNAFDPMQNQMKAGLASTMDQTNASLANSGLASTPYGASVGAGAAGNFMNNWQTAQINRENTGANSAAALQGQQLAAQQTGGQLINQAGQLDQGAMNSILSQYGLSEQGAASAAQTLAQIFGNLGVSQSSSRSSSMSAS